MERELVSYGSEEDKLVEQFDYGNGELNTGEEENEEDESDGSYINEESDGSKDSYTDKYEAI